MSKNIKKTYSNPTNKAKKCNFVLDAFDKYKPRQIGTCVCGTRGTASIDSFSKKKFCRDEDCEYYQKNKRLDVEEMQIIMEEKGCEVFNISGSETYENVKFRCQCGFIQTNTWNICKKPDNYCKHYMPLANPLLQF